MTTVRHGTARHGTGTVAFPSALQHVAYSVQIESLNHTQAAKFVGSILFLYVI